MQWEITKLAGFYVFGNEESKLFDKNHEGFAIRSVSSRCYLDGSSEGQGSRADLLLNSGNPEGDKCLQWKIKKLSSVILCNP